MNGLCFENAIVTGPGTPTSMAGVFTGSYTPIYGMNINEWRRFFESRVTLAEILRFKGYNTVAFNTNPYTLRLFGFDKGFLYYNDFIEKSVFANSSRKWSIIELLVDFINKKGIFIS